MGTTLTAMTGSGGRFDTIVMIEGIKYLLTDGSTSAAVTAWAGTDWSNAIGNLMVVGGVEQRLEPWSGRLDVSKLSFAVMPTEDTATGDIFGRLVFGTGAGAETKLTVALDRDDTTVTVQDCQVFSGSTGEVHIGTECIAYTGKGGGDTTLTGCTRGKYAPQTESNGGFSREHKLGTVGEGIYSPPKVTSLPRTWKGRWVEVWMHRNVGGTLDVKAQAQRVWAGRIAGTRDEANGLTYVDCESVQSAFQDCVMMRDQFVCRPAVGIYLAAGWRFTAADTEAAVLKQADDLVVVSSGASGNYEVNEGRYTYSELLTILNAWLGQARADGDLNLSWAVTQVAGPRTQIVWSGGSAVDTNSTGLTAKNAVLNFLGFTQSGADLTTGAIGTNWISEVTSSILSVDEPCSTYMISGSEDSVDVVKLRGTYFDNEPYLPPAMGIYTAEMLVMQVNGGPLGLFALGDVDADNVPTRLVGLGGHPFLDAISGEPWDETFEFRHIRLSDEGVIELKQVAIIQSRLKWLLDMSAASTGTQDFNFTDPAGGTHGDRFPSQLSAAVPWTYLGDNWYQSLVNLDDGLTMLAVIDKPTKWTEVFMADLMARQLHIVWKNQGLVLRTWATPTAARSLHTFTEDNKAIAVGTDDSHRTPANDDDSALKNVITLEYDRVLNGGYRSSITMQIPASQEANGDNPMTLSMRNAFGGLHTTNATVIELGDQLAVSAAMFRDPLRIVTRTISPAFYENCAPGDFCTITDNFVRDPLTGARGVSTKAGLIVRHRHDWGGYEIDTEKTRDPSGEVDILILPLANISPYSPAAEVSSYNAGTKVITCLAHSHSLATEAADASHFEVGDEVYVVETDPDDPASFLSWSDVVANVSGNDITLTTGLAGYDAAKTYRVVSDTYNTVGASQQADVYQGDDATGSLGFAYGNDPTQAGDWESEGDGYGGATFALPSLYSDTMGGDGRPLHTGLESDRARLANSLIRHRCTSLMSTLNRGSAKSYTGSGSKILEIVPLHFGPGDLMTGDRTVRIGVWASSTDGTSTRLDISLCRRPPIGTSMETTDLTAPAYAMVGPYETQSTTGITSTSYTRYDKEFSMRSVDPFTGLAYLVVEVRTKCQIRGVTDVLPFAYEEEAA